MEKKYICIRDKQYGDFGMHWIGTAKEWGKCAYEWADNDGWENPKGCLLKSFKSEQECINFIADMWELDIRELTIEDKEVVNFVNVQLAETNPKSWLYNVYKEMAKILKEQEYSNIIDKIQDKINEAENCEETDITEDYIKGYINGLKMAQYILREELALYGFRL